MVETRGTVQTAGDGSAESKAFKGRTARPEGEDWQGQTAAAPVRLVTVTVRDI